MAKICDLSGKKTVSGNRRRHMRGSAGGATGGAWSRKAQVTKRRFQPNLIRNVKVIDKQGNVVKMNLATKVVKRMRKYGSYKGYVLADQSSKEQA